MYLKSLSKNIYKKIPTNVDIHLTTQVTVEGTYSGVLPFVKVEYKQITQDMINSGYFKLQYFPISSASVSIIKNGKVCINQNSNDTSLTPDFVVVDDLVGIRNGIDLHGTVSSGLAESFTLNDILCITYQYSVLQKYQTLTFTITSTDVSNGYKTLPFTTPFPEHVLAVMREGSLLLNAYQAYTIGQQPDFIIANNLFVFKNNVQTPFFTSNNLTEFIQENDVITLISCGIPE